MKWTVGGTTKDPETIPVSAVQPGHFPVAKAFHKLAVWNKKTTKASILQ